MSLHTTVTLQCDWPGCAEHGAPMSAADEARGAARDRGWATDRQRTVVSRVPGRQDYCPQHRAAVHRARLEGRRIRPDG